MTTTPHRHRPPPDTIEVNPHTVTVIGRQPIVSLVFDLGAQQPAIVVQLPTDLQAIVHRKLGEKLNRQEKRE